MYHGTYPTDFTNLDDKIVIHAREKGIRIQELAARFPAEHYQITRELNIKAATVDSCAPEHKGLHS
ncbi:MAG: hypothetical protein DRO73_06130 [Candidatus Thorarchaeota archaeon]|nr:MAG: hypothetical protein DRO73_06130 [Candidatus Thorarchaeota archaeon]